MAALCALALTACGTERAGHKGPKADPGDRIEADSPSATSTEGDGAEFFAFMELLLTLSEPCVKDNPDPELAMPPKSAKEPAMESSPEEPPPTALLPEPPLPPDAPPPREEPQDPEAAKKELELSAAEQCEARVHARRITKSLADTPDRTPGQVKEALRSLGYIDERIHGLQRANESVEFTLDLRLLGGQLCLSGSVTGTNTAFDPYGGSPEVECLDVERRR